jgi:beta-1,4-mannosyl-glycoprotein beta-1,4-N-acetylglucosaminyltransferase
MKIVDCFIFYNELQLLEYRLSILYNVVDYFIIVESRQTFVGKDKELLYEINKNKFNKFKDKIIHIVVDLPYKYPNIDYKNNKPFQNYNYNENGQQWMNEAFQRESLTEGFKQISFEDNDYIIVSDADEIPDPDTLNEIKNGKISPFEIYKLKQDLYYYNLNSKREEMWTHPYIMSYGFFNKYKKDIEIPIEKCIYFEHGYKFLINNDERMFLTELRLNNSSEISYLEKGGWHLTYFGNHQFIKNKYENFSHVEISTDRKDLKKISDDIENHNKIGIKDNGYLPYKFEKYLSNYITTW